MTREEILSEIEALAIKWDRASDSGATKEMRKQYRFFSGELMKLVMRLRSCG